MTPAQAMAEALTARGIDTQASQSRLLKVGIQSWNRWVSGKKKMREDSIQKALTAAREAGWDLRLEWRADGVTATAATIERGAA